MTRESAFTKGRRLLTEGRLNVRSVTAEEIVAACRGDSGEMYAVGWFAGPGWHCTCPARGQSCAHLVALKLITVVTQPARSPAPGTVTPLLRKDRPA